jgi:hypothetical protein
MVTPNSALQSMSIHCRAPAWERSEFQIGTTSQNLPYLEHCLSHKTKDSVDCNIIHLHAGSWSNYFQVAKNYNEPLCDPDYSVSGSTCRELQTVVYNLTAADIENEYFNISLA